MATEDEPLDPRLDKKVLDGWEPVEPVRPIGEGRQGAVYVVRNVDAYRLRSHSAEKMTEAVKRINRGEGAATYVLADELARYQRADEGRLGAVKLFKFGPGEEGKRDRARFAQEVAILRDSRYPGLLRLLHANVRKEFFITRLYPATLQERLSLFGGEVAKTLEAIYPVISAVAWLYDSKRTVHRDIKPDNMFVDEDGSVALGDLGIAIEVSADAERRTQIGDKRPKGTIYWMAPWAYRGDRPVPIDEIDGSFDVFSLGKVIWSMLLGKPIYSPHAFADDPDSEYNLERVFPHIPAMKSAAELLRKCVVRSRGDCLDSPGKLRTEVSKILHEMNAPRAFDLAARRVTGRCGMCNRGAYVFASQGGAGVGTLSNLLTWNCNACGHVVMFATDGGQPFQAWTR